MQWFLHKMLPYVVIVGVLVAVFLHHRHRVRCLNEHPRYTVGVTEEYFTTAAGDKEISYVFIIHGECVLGSHTRYQQFNRHSRYFVRFDSTNARNSELLSTPLVPDTLLNIPPGGWASLPVPH